MAQNLTANVVSLYVYIRHEHLTNSVKINNGASQCSKIDKFGDFFVNKTSPSVKLMSLVICGGTSQYSKIDKFGGFFVNRTNPSVKLAKLVTCNSASQCLKFGRFNNDHSSSEKTQHHPLLLGIDNHHKIIILRNSRW